MIGTMFSICGNKANNTQTLRKATAYVCISAITLSACTTQLTTVREDPKSIAPVQGFPYRLPVKNLELSISWRLTKCEFDQESAKIQIANLDFDQDAIYKTNIFGGELYSLDYRKMTKTFKTGKIDVKYYKRQVSGQETDKTDDDTFESTGILESINANIEGKESEAITSTIGFATNIAKSLLKRDLPSTLAGQPGAIKELNPPKLCSNEIYEAINSLEKIPNELKDLEEKSKNLSERISALQKRIIGDNLIDNDKKKYEEINKKIDIIDIQIAMLKKNKSKYEKLLTYSEEFNFSPSDGEMEKIYSPDRKKLEKWLESLGINKDVMFSLFGSKDKITDEIAVQASITRLVEVANVRGSTPINDNSYSGFVMRDPVDVKFTLKAVNQPSKPIISKNISMPQLGRIRQFELKSGFAEKNEITLMFAQDGSLLSGKHDKSKAGGPEIAKAFDTASASVLEIATLAAENRQARYDAEEKRREAREKKEKTELQLLDERIEIIEAQKKIETLRAGDDTQQKILEQEINILKLKKEKKELESFFKKDK